MMSSSSRVDQDCGSLLGFHPPDRERDHVEIAVFVSETAPVGIQAFLVIFSFCNQEHELHSNRPYKNTLWSDSQLT